MPKVSRHLLRYTYCATGAMGDKRHHGVFDCPHFQGLWQQHAGMSQDSHCTHCNMQA